jgi:hypothetical protein
MNKEVNRYVSNVGYWSSSAPLDPARNRELSRFFNWRNDRLVWWRYI